MVVNETLQPFGFGTSSLISRNSVVPLCRAGCTPGWLTLLVEK